jgi:hypothetical protein
MYIFRRTDHVFEQHAYADSNFKAERTNELQALLDGIKKIKHITVFITSGLRKR